MIRGFKKRLKLILVKCIFFLNIYIVEFCKKNIGSLIFWYFCKK